MALTIDDQLYKNTVQDRINLGANFRRVRYSGTELTLKPNMDAKGQRVQGSRDEPIGVFFETYTFWLGKFAIEDDSLPSASISVGATWEVLEETRFADDAESWQNTFILSQPKQAMLWYEIELAKFIASANMTVTYEIPTGTYTVVNGNSTPDVTTSTFTAVVSQQQRGELVEDDGLPPVSRLYLEGYMVNPQTTPLDANTGKLLPATITNPTGTLEGEFILIATAQPPQTGSTAGRGELIKGLFLLSGDDRA